jgi:Putative peptidoglycan binding domain
VTKPLLAGLVVAVLVWVLLLDGSSFTGSDLAEPPSPNRIRSELVPEDSTQVVVVTTNGSTDTIAQVATFERRDGDWAKVGGTFSSRIARNGISDGVTQRPSVTPSGTFALVSSFGEAPNPGTAIPYRQAGATDCWLNAPHETGAGPWVQLAACADVGIRMLDPTTDRYDVAIIAAPQRGIPAFGGFFLRAYELSAGSAPLTTDRDVSMAFEDVRSVLLSLRTGSNPVVIVGTEEWLTEQPAPQPWTTLREGSTGGSVEAVQQALTSAGIPTTVDGTYGPRTTANVTLFQQQRALPPTGIVDEETAIALGVYTR